MGFEPGASNPVDRKLYRHTGNFIGRLLVKPLIRMILIIPQYFILLFSNYKLLFASPAAA
jgi:hypothetical protein